MQIEEQELEIRASEYIELAKTEGLPKQDYNKIKKLYDKARILNLREESSWHKIVIDLYNILKQYKKSGILTGFQMDDEYILKNASLVPLVLANNEGQYKVQSGKLYIDSQFAKDNNMLMQINTEKNELHCKKSHISLHNIPYISRIENLTKREAMFLICYIFNYMIPKEEESLIKLSEKYKRIITSSEYKEIVKELYMQNSVALQRELNTILRVENDINDENFSYKLADNKIYLPKQ